MPLTATQRDFITNLLGVKPKSSGYSFPWPSEVMEALTDWQITGNLDDYLKREGEVISAIKQLETLTVTPARIDLLEKEVEQVQARVKSAKRETGSDTIKQAYQTLDAIKLRVTTLKGQAERYRDGLQRAEQKHALLVHKVIKPEADDIQTRLIDKAKSHGVIDEHELACNLLGQVDGECTKAQLLADAYDKALAKAKKDLNDARSTMLAPDIEKVQKTMIDPAVDKAGKGERLAALDLLAKVAPHCRTSLAANLKAKVDMSNTAGKTYQFRVAPMTQLKTHAQHAEFAKEIAALQAKLDSARELAAKGLNADQEMNALFWDAKAKLEFADSHDQYVGDLAAAKNLIEQLKLADPATSNAAVAIEIKALEDAIDKSGRLAGKRQYDLAQATLTKVTEDCAKGTTKKQDHASYARELLRLEPKVQSCPDVAGTPSEAEAKVVRELLLQAKTLAAEPGRDYAGAVKVLAKLSTACDAIDQLAAKTKQDGEEHKAVVGLLDSDLPASLVAARKLLEALKKRPGHDGIEKQIKEIDTLLVEADKALNT